MPSLKDRAVLIIGRGSGIARAIALAVSEDGGRVIATGRHPDDLAGSYHSMDIGIEHVDVTDESSVAALAGRIAAVDHVVSLDGTRLRLEPRRGVIPHGIDHDLTASEVSPGRQP
jgi:NAD(P)-dependent dehydrogenase (short-subunit alcohol dehydrogenase family)